MSINWKELDLILSELPLLDSYIQKIVEHSYNSLTIHLFNKIEKAWMLYVEVGTSHSRINRTERNRKKSEKNQRFTQYLKKHVIGRRITNVYQYPFDRAVKLELTNSEDSIFLIIRLYSGPGANIIVVDKDNKILELLFRRPKRNEIEGKVLIEELRSDEGDKKFSIREYPSSMSFNMYIDTGENDLDYNEKLNKLILQIETERNKEIDYLNNLILNNEEKLKSLKNYDDYLKIASLLSSSLHLVKKGMEEVEVEDYENNTKILIPLSPSLSPKENLDKYYSKYKKDKKSYELIINELDELKTKVLSREEYYTSLLSSPNLSKLEKVSSQNSKKTNTVSHSGLEINSYGYKIIVGRNDKENEKVLKEAKGNDLWFHTRDYSGGYIIVKKEKNKTIPYNVTLDAISLAIFYSKARNNKNADLYQTEVKYLKRVKGGKTGLVIPTQEKNIIGTLDEVRVKKLLEERK